VNTIISPLLIFQCVSLSSAASGNVRVKKQENREIFPPDFSFSFWNRVRCKPPWAAPRSGALGRLYVCLLDMGPVLELGPWIRQMGPGIALPASPLAGADIDAVTDFGAGHQFAPGAVGNLEDCHLGQRRLYGCHW
jgi:hypothetical protein